MLRPEVVAELERFDAVIASTRFIEDVARRHLRSPAVLYAPQPLAVADGPRPAPDRGRFGIPPAAVAVLVSFDPSSDLERKNPRAALEAFARAATHAPQLRLVIKLMLPPAGADGLAPRLAWLRAAAAADPRIIVIDDALDDVDLYALFASCDAYLSLHRAEGLGLGMLEAMHLGLPVVATAYSGNMSFMDARSACLVPFRTVPVQGTSLPTYAAVAALGPTWADPDVDAAAAHLVRLANDADWRADRGRAAAFAAATYQREALGFEWLAALAAIARERQARAPASRRVVPGRLGDVQARLTVGVATLDSVEAAEQRHVAPPAVAERHLCHAVAPGADVPDAVAEDAKVRLSVPIPVEQQRDVAGGATEGEGLVDDAVAVRVDVPPAPVVDHEIGDAIPVDVRRQRNVAGRAPERKSLLGHAVEPRVDVPGAARDR